jgi:hypothetical protein
VAPALVRPQILQVIRNPPVGPGGSSRVWVGLSSRRRTPCCCFDCAPVSPRVRALSVTAPRPTIQQAIPSERAPARGELAPERVGADGGAADDGGAASGGQHRLAARGPAHGVLLPSAGGRLRLRPVRHGPSLVGVTLALPRLGARDVRRVADAHQVGVRLAGPDGPAAETAPLAVHVLCLPLRRAHTTTEGRRYAWHRRGRRPRPPTDTTPWTPRRRPVTGLPLRGGVLVVERLRSG